MARHAGGSKVAGGHYVDTRSLAVVKVPAGGTLPGTPAASFVRVPWPVLLAAAPVVGGFFTVTLPIFGFATGAYGLARRAARATGTAARELTATVSPGQAVGEAHLTGKRGEGVPRSGAETAPDPGIESLQREIGERRSGEDG